MTSPEPDRLDAISDALARLVQRQSEIDARLLRIEAVLGLATAQPPPLPASWDRPVEAAAGLPPGVLESPPERRPQPEKSDPTAETRFGLGWLNRIAAVTLLLGVAFFFKYAVDNEWIGPGMRVALGIVAATFSLFLGEWLSQRGQRVFAQGLNGLGLALLYLSFYAGFDFYHLFSQPLAFALMFLTTCGAVGLALHSNAQAVGLLGLIGGFLTPVLLSSGSDRLGTLAVYSVILNLGAMAVAQARRWPALDYVALAGTGLLYAGWVDHWLFANNTLAAFAWLSVTFLIYFAGSVMVARLWLVALNTGAYFAGAYFLLNTHYQASVGTFTLALAILHGALAQVFARRNSLLAQLAAGIAIVLLTLAIPIQFAGFRIPMLWALEAAAVAWLAARFQHPRFQMGAWLLFALVFVSLFTQAASLLTFVVTAASLWVASYFAVAQDSDGESKVVTYGAGHFVMLWGWSLEITAWARRTAEPADVNNISSAGVSAWMAVYALALVAAGVAGKSAVNRILGLALFALVIAKLYLLDVWQFSRGFRITAFLALGALLMLVSYLYSRFRPAIENLWKESGAEKPE